NATSTYKLERTLPILRMFLSERLLDLYILLYSISLFQFTAQGEVALVAAATDVALVHRAAHGTARLVAVGAVGETAVRHEVGDLDKVSVEFFRLDVPHRQGAQTGGIGEIAANVQLDQLTVAGGVDAFLRVTADILDR